MQVQYEGVVFEATWSSSLERHLIKQMIKRKIGKPLGKPYQVDPYLLFAESYLSSIENPVVVDIGANIGTTVLPLAKKYPQGRFYAIEPHPLPASRFLKNCQKNRLSNVSLISSAIHPHSSMAQIFTCPSNSGGHRLSGFEGRDDLKKVEYCDPIHIPTISLKNLFETLQIPKCDLLKIDTEGFEYFVMESLEELLSPDFVKAIVAEYGTEGLKAVGKNGWDIVSLGLQRGYNCRLLDSGEPIRSEKDLPLLPDFSVTDFLFTVDGV